MDRSEFESVFNRYLECINVNLSTEQFDMFYLYMKELLDWNEKINLTAITEPDEIVLKHFVDSLIIERYIDGESIIDVGTGAGFPGVPLKIYRNDLKVVLLDSLNKRINFLNDVIYKLNFSNINAIHGRAENFGQLVEYREQFDMVTSRAVANLKALSEYMMPFVKVGRYLYLYEGAR